MASTDFSGMTVVELRQELKKRNLSQAGKKADLVDRLVAYENEKENAKDEHPSEPIDEPIDDKELADDSAAADKNASSATADNSTDSNPPAKDASGEISNPIEADDLADKPATDVPDVAPEVVNDAASRKRRSRSPPPENGVSRKRARADGHATSNDAGQTEIQPLSDRDREPSPQATAKEDVTAGRASNGKYEDDYDRSREPTPPHREQPTERSDEPMPDYDRHVAPAQHPATSALYIKNFMRPLRENQLRDYLIDLAAPSGAAPDPDCIVDFYLDQIRTHAFVRFTSTSAASRVRSALHGTVWPKERNRKELWVDFIPEDKVADWIDREQAEGGRGSSAHWEVIYEPDDNGDIVARLVNAEAEPVRRNSTRQPAAAPPPPPPSGGPARPAPTGVEGAPSGPRGRGTNHYRQAPAASYDAPPADSYEPQPEPGRRRRRRADGEPRTTRAHPPIHYRPVSEEVAQRRLANMNAYITKDRHRDLGRPEDINRYTFENGEDFVDRGKEAFVGIRPPHRERERRRLGIGRGPGGGGGGGGSGSRGAAPPPPPRRRSQSPPRRGRDDNGYDRYRDRDDRERDRDRHRDDVLRSRLDGQPLPTYTGGGGGGGRSGRRGGRRDRH